MARRHGEVRRLVRRPLAFVVFALVVAASACGGGSNGDSNLKLSEAKRTTTTSAPTSSTVVVTTSTLPPVVLSTSTTAKSAATTTTARTAGTTTTAPASPTTTVPPKTWGISIKNFAFSPPVLQIHVGDTVTVKNEDTPTHTWTADDGSFNSGNLAPGASFSHTFAKAGTVTYHCNIHASMKGTIQVS